MDALLNATPPIPFHTFAALAALLLGIVQLSMKKGGKTHRILGRLWVGLMLAVAISSFFIHEINLWGKYSYIHLLSIFTIFSLVLAVHYARTGQIKRHKKVMVLMFWLALVLTGMFTLLPGRVMHQVIFG